MRKTFVLPLILLVVVLVACVAPTPTPAPKPTDPPKPTVAPTVVPTVVPTVAPTKAPEPTKAPAPTTAPTQAAISRCGTTANVTITYVGDPAGTYPAAEKATIERFSKICPNITVKRIDGDASGQNLLASYLTAFEAKSSTIDVIRVDVVWPGILAPHLLDMKKYVTQQQIDAFLPGMVQNNTLDGKLVALPLRIGFGMLYYRTDLLQKYGFSAPPATWKELETMAQKIQDGERAAGNKDFWGYVWQGDAFEGLTCNALEWQVSNGGGAIVSPDRKIQVNNKETIAALERAASWVGKISPPGVVKHKEEDSRAIFHAGNAAFMRNWPYVYMPTKGSEVMGTKFDVAPLPAGDSGKGASALGGWQIGVSRYSANPDAAAAFAIYLTSAENMKFLSVETSAPPAIASLYAEPEIKKTMPFANLDIVKITTPRPSTITAQKYNEVSTLYFTAVNKILSGQVDAKSAMAQLELDLQKLLK